MSHYLTDNMLRSTKMTIYDFASGVTMHGFNHVFVKEMNVHYAGPWLLKPDCSATSRLDKSGHP